MKKSIVVFLVVFLGGLILNVYTSILWEIREVASQLDVTNMILYHISAMMLCFMLGLLLEHQRLVQLTIQRGKIKTSSSFYFGLVLLALAMFPPVFYVINLGSFQPPFPKGGVGINMFIGLFNQFSNVQAILSVMAGSLIIKGITPQSKTTFHQPTR